MLIIKEGAGNPKPSFYLLLILREMKPSNLLIIIASSILAITACKKDKSSGTASTDILQLVTTKIGTTYLSLETTNTGIPIDKGIVIRFSTKLDTSLVTKNILLTKGDTSILCNVAYLDEFKTVTLTPRQSLKNLTSYNIQITSGLKGMEGESFPGVAYTFTTINGEMLIENILLNGKVFNGSTTLQNIDPKAVSIVISFSQALTPSNYQSFITLSGNSGLSFSLSTDNKKLTVSNTTKLNYYQHYYFVISSSLTASNGYLFGGFNNSFYTQVDSTPKFTVLTDDALLTLVQQQTFKYFWDFAHASCGMARERNTSGDIVTTGGSGFGVMALIVGMDRGFITRADGLTRLDLILSFLETCDRYHGAWPHWLNGTTGKVVPFTTNDDGADLVETSYMVQGLLTMRQYLDSSLSKEKAMVDRINSLCSSVEYDWFTRDENVLYWNWSPNSGWAVNVKIQGYNETLITYILAGTSTTHPISANVYKTGYAGNGSIENGNTYYGYQLPLGEAYGGPLFFTQYSYLGLDPRLLQDSYANYWKQNVNQSLINHAYCATNPLSYIGYSGDCWGLTASDNPNGYSAQSPTNDLGVITPTAAISSIPYTPTQSLAAIKFFYYVLGDKLWGDYGFYDAFDVTAGWWASSYLAIDEGPIICMIENYRTGLLWNLFMSAPEVKTGLDKLGFTY
jgi:hypothetical protein